MDERRHFRPCFCLAFVAFVSRNGGAEQYGSDAASVSVRCTAFRAERPPLWPRAPKHAPPTQKTAVLTERLKKVKSKKAHMKLQNALYGLSF